MTLSEFVQAFRLRELHEGRSGYSSPPPLECTNGTRIVVDAAPDAHSWPQTYHGPWTIFSVTWTGGESPGNLFAPNRAIGMPAGDLVRLLERLGWPEAQLGKRWKSKRGNVPAGR